MRVIRKGQLHSGMNGYNDNIHKQQIDKLQQLFPEAVTEGKIDW